MRKAFYLIILWLSFFAFTCMDMLMINYVASPMKTTLVILFSPPKTQEGQFLRRHPDFQHQHILPSTRLQIFMLFSYENTTVNDFRNW